MTDRPEALRLADAMDNALAYGLRGREVAAELRRLHGENERLREAGVGYSQQTMDAVVREREELRALNAELLAALKDMHSGWKYIRETHGDLYGVGWDRSQGKAEAVIAKAEDKP